MNFANYSPNHDMFALVLISYYETPIWPNRGWPRAKLVFESISPISHQCNNECVAGAHPLPVEVSQPAQPQLHDCLHLLHQVSLLHPWLFVQEVYTPSPRCGRVLSKPGGAWWCDRCRAPPARCSVCHAVVKGLFVWCQVKYKPIVYPTYNYQRIKKLGAVLPWLCFMQTS